jgi:hypothetical protein
MRDSLRRSEGSFRRWDHSWNGAEPAHRCLLVRFDWHRLPLGDTTVFGVHPRAGFWAAEIRAAVSRGSRGRLPFP